LASNINISKRNCTLEWVRHHVYWVSISFIMLIFIFSPWNRDAKKTDDIILKQPGRILLLKISSHTFKQNCWNISFCYMLCKMTRLVNKKLSVLRRVLQYRYREGEVCVSGDG
jgi:hypothetical protein